MTTHVYLAYFRREVGGAYSVTFPDVPGAISEGGDFNEAFSNAKDALDSLLDSLASDGLPFPTASDPEKLLAKANGAIVSAVEGETESKAMRVNITVDERLLARIDRAAENSGYTRSGLLANAARKWLREKQSQAEHLSQNALSRRLETSANDFRMVTPIYRASTGNVLPRADEFHYCSWPNYVALCGGRDWELGEGEEVSVAESSLTIDLGPAEFFVRSGKKVFRQRLLSDDDEAVTVSEDARRPS